MPIRTPATVPERWVCKSSRRPVGFGLQGTPKACSLGILVHVNKDPATSARQPRQGTNHQTCITKLQGVDVLVCGKCFWPFAGRASQSGHLEAAHWPKAEFTYTRAERRIPPPLRDHRRCNGPFANREKPQDGPRRRHGLLLLADRRNRAMSTTSSELSLRTHLFPPRVLGAAVPGWPHS